MKKKQWYKPWYIWLGIWAFLILSHLSLHTIDKYETKLKIGYPSQRALSRKVWKDTFFFCVVVIAIPTATVGVLFSNTGNFFLEHLHMVYFYFAGVYATHRHALWREKNISHLLKKNDQHK